MTRPLALHQITANEASPMELASIAAETGCQQVCIFTHIPAVAAGLFPAVTQDTLKSMQDRLRQTGVTVGNIEFFPITADADIDSYRPGLALGGELGAARAVTHVHDPDSARAADRLGRLADLAAGYGLSLGLEFMTMTPGCTNIAKAAWFVDQIGRNLGIAVDALHLVRSGGAPADVAAIPARYFSYSQICDGRGLHQSSDYMPEALDREMPGDGDFPLQAIIEALPLAAALDVEVPSVKLAQAGVPALDRAREAVRRARALIEAARVTR